ncbi:heparin lyase I family protein [Nubsella zeaxanthinifaciens]|uniref:heparin lyase I family protein n=1 Tax=Nubsella zeaxanthinifaciens TaxID=392412 RepID=UPI000DE3E14B|nr:heparin lyase I family protein [Nubsella zeaxanthinifaciens]
MNKQSLLLVSLIALFFSCSKKKTSSTPEILKSEEQAKTSTDGPTLSANGTTDTYQLINSVFGGTGDVIEAPDCSHLGFGKHITQVYDNDLKRNVFAFLIHVSPDNDKCEDSDRQRNEIKTYDRSPENLKASRDERVLYRWKFKLDANFKPSSDFTHIHQLKPIDGDNQLPIITLTPRYRAAGDVMQVIHTGETDATSQKYIVSVPLSDFKGQWVEVIERATFSFDGKYEIQINRISDGKVLVKQAFTNIEMWRKNCTSSRPKWGIYRRLLQADALRDETVLFNDFNITEY